MLAHRRLAQSERVGDLGRAAAAQIAFQHDRVCRLPLATREAVDGELAERDAVGMVARRFELPAVCDVMFGQRVLTDQTPGLANVKLKRKVAVVGVST